MATKLHRRWMRQRRSKRPQEEVELNVTAMLDMAFQLLAFFILTFEPSPVESLISLQMPPPDKAVTENVGTENEQTPDISETIFDLPLPVSLHATAGGEIEKIVLGTTKEISGGSAAQIQATLASELAELLKLEFDGIKLQIDERLHYESLMQVVDTCMRQKLPSGEQLTKINFILLPAAQGN